MKKFIDNLIRMPLYFIILFFQNSWKALLVGFGFIITFLIGAVYDKMYLPLAAFIIICLIPLFLNICSIGKYFQLMKKGRKTTADICFTLPPKNRIGVKFKDIDGNEQHTEINLVINSKIRKLKQIDIVYDIEKPENACVPKYTLMNCIFNVIFASIFAFPFIFMVISIIYAVRGI